MKNRLCAHSIVLAFAVGMSALASAAEPAGWGVNSAESASCRALNAILASPSVQPPNSSNLGQAGTFAPGDVITVNATLGASTSGVFRIVGDPSGTVTLAGPANASGTLSYTVTGPLPVGAIGVGVRIDAVNGQGLTIQGSCTDAPRNVPAANTTVIVAGALLLAAIGFGLGSRRLKRQ